MWRKETRVWESVRRLCPQPREEPEVAVGSAGQEGAPGSPTCLIPGIKTVSRRSWVREGRPRSRVQFWHTVRSLLDLQVCTCLAVRRQAWSLEQGTQVRNFLLEKITEPCRLVPPWASAFVFSWPVLSLIPQKGCSDCFLSLSNLPPTPLLSTDDITSHLVENRGHQKGISSTCYC